MGQLKRCRALESNSRRCVCSSRVAFAARDERRRKSMGRTASCSSHRTSFCALGLTLYSPNGPEKASSSTKYCTSSSIAGEGCGPAGAPLWTRSQFCRCASVAGFKKAVGRKSLLCLMAPRHWEARHGVQNRHPDDIRIIPLCRSALLETRHG